MLNQKKPQNIMTIRLLSIFLFSLLFVFLSCNKDDEPLLIESPEIAEETVTEMGTDNTEETDGMADSETPEDNLSQMLDIFIAGGFQTRLPGNSLSVKKPAYWINGEQIELSKTSSAIATDIYVNNESVHIVGFDRIGGTLAPIYWENGEATTLLAPTIGFSTAKAIEIFNDDVHIAGQNQDPFFNTSILYWKNGVLQEITDDSISARMNAMLVYNNTVYIAGREILAGKGLFDIVEGAHEPIAKYWKNGEGITLTDGRKSAEALAITQENGDIYVAGYENENEGPLSRSVPKYWKNGVMQDTFSEDGKIISIAVSDNIVHLLIRYVDGTGSGVGTTKIRYYKNGDTIFTKEWSDASITVEDENVYITGTDSSYGGFFMHNGTISELTSSLDVKTEINGIHLVTSSP